MANTEEEKYGLDGAASVPVAAMPATSIYASALARHNQAQPPKLARVLKRMADERNDDRESVRGAESLSQSLSLSKKPKTTESTVAVAARQHHALKVEAVVAGFMDKLPEWRTTKMIEDATKLGLTQVHLYVDDGLAYKRLLKDEVVPLVQIRVDARFGSGMLRVFWHEFRPSLTTSAKTLYETAEAPAMFGSIRCDWSNAAETSGIPMATAAAAAHAQQQQDAQNVLVRHRWAAATRATIDAWIARVPTTEMLHQNAVLARLDQIVGNHLATRRVVNNPIVHENLRKTNGLRAYGPEEAFQTTIDVGGDPVREAEAIRALGDAHNELRRLERAYRKSSAVAKGGPPSEHNLAIGQDIALQWQVIRGLERTYQLKTVPLPRTRCECPCSAESMGITYCAINVCPACLKAQ